MSERQRSQFAEAFIAAIEAMDDPHKKPRERIHTFLREQGFVRQKDYTTFTGWGDWLHPEQGWRVSGDVVDLCVTGTLPATDLLTMIEEAMQGQR